MAVTCQWLKGIWGKDIYRNNLYKCSKKDQARIEVILRLIWLSSINTNKVRNYLNLNSKKTMWYIIKRDKLKGLKQIVYGRYKGIIYLIIKCLIIRNSLDWRI
jgi:hypothetical protein